MTSAVTTLVEHERRAGRAAEAGKRRVRVRAVLRWLDLQKDPMRKAGELDIDAVESCGLLVLPHVLMRGGVAFVLLSADLLRMDTLKEGDVVEYIATSPVDVSTVSLREVLE